MLTSIAYNYTQDKLRCVLFFLIVCLVVKHNIFDNATTLKPQVRRFFVRSNLLQPYKVKLFNHDLYFCRQEITDGV